MLLCHLYHTFKTAAVCLLASYQYRCPCYAQSLCAEFMHRLYKDAGCKSHITACLYMCTSNSIRLHIQMGGGGAGGGGCQHKA